MERQLLAKRNARNFGKEGTVSTAERIINEAMEQAMPIHGEGWNDFVTLIRIELVAMENENKRLRELLKECQPYLHAASVFHLGDYRGWDLCEKVEKELDNE